MKVHFTCTYCNHDWTEQVYTHSKESVRRCGICKDTRLKAKEVNEVKIDYYQSNEDDKDE